MIHCDQFQRHHRTLFHNLHSQQSPSTATRLDEKGFIALLLCSTNHVAVQLVINWILTNTTNKCPYQKICEFWSILRSDRQWQYRSEHRDSTTEWTVCVLSVASSLFQFCASSFVSIFLARSASCCASWICLNRTRPARSIVRLVSAPAPAHGYHNFRAVSLRMSSGCTSPCCWPTPYFVRSGSFMNIRAAPLSSLELSLENIDWAVWLSSYGLFGSCCTYSACLASTSESECKCKMRRFEQKTTLRAHCAA